MPCSISTSPATSGSIVTPNTFLWPSIFTVIMPPPADASTRMAAICSCSFSCICCACFIIACMLPGIFIGACVTPSLIQISHGAHLRIGKDLLEAFDSRMRQRALAQAGVAAHCVAYRLRRCADGQVLGHLHSHSHRFTDHLRGNPLDGRILHR